MRYYIYLDKSFLKSLVSVVNNLNLDLEVVEFSSKKTYGTVQDVSLEPKLERIVENEKCIDKVKEKDESLKKSCGRTRRLRRIDYKAAESHNYQTSYERRYINIEDVSEMRNSTYFHKLIEELKGTTRGVDDSIYFERGQILPYKLKGKYIYEKPDRDEEDTKNIFVKLNDTYIWLDSQKLDSDILTISSIVDNVNVLGYTIRHKPEEGYKVVKAIAIYIE